MLTRSSARGGWQITPFVHEVAMRELEKAVKSVKRILTRARPVLELLIDSVRIARCGIGFR